MSVQTTKTITRQEAIGRILTVSALVECQYFSRLEEITIEPHIDLAEWVTNQCLLSAYTRKQLENWTNDMLESLMDEPFYRRTEFENYIVEGK